MFSGYLLVFEARSKHTFCIASIKSKLAVHGADLQFEGVQKHCLVTGRLSIFYFAKRRVSLKTIRYSTKGWVAFYRVEQ